MPVFRITTEKSSVINPKFVNRYYLLAATLAEAATLGEAIAEYEKIIFGSTVNFDNVHIDALATAEFTNVPLTGIGSVSQSNPAKSFIVARIHWGVPGSYPHYKNYRLHMQGAALNGVNWGSSQQTQLALFVTAMNDDFLGILCTKSGTPLSAAVVDTEYYMQQENNKWFDRN